MLGEHVRIAQGLRDRFGLELQEAMRVVDYVIREAGTGVGGPDLSSPSVPSPEAAMRARRVGPETL